MGKTVKKIYAVLGVLATLTGLISFVLGKNLPEILDKEATSISASTSLEQDNNVALTGQQLPTDRAIVKAVSDYSVDSIIEDAKENYLQIDTDIYKRPAKYLFGALNIMKWLFLGMIAISIFSNLLENQSGLKGLAILCIVGFLIYYLIVGELAAYDYHYSDKYKIQEASYDSQENQYTFVCLNSKEKVKTFSIDADVVELIEYYDGDANTLIKLNLQPDKWYDWILSKKPKQRNAYIVY